MSRREFVRGGAAAAAGVAAVIGVPLACSSAPDLQSALRATLEERRPPVQGYREGAAAGWNWILQSGVRNGLDGSLFYSYNRTTGRFGAVYPDTMGHFVSLGLRRVKDRDLTAEARQTAQLLIRHQDRGVDPRSRGSMANGVFPQPHGGRNVHWTLDNGNVIEGLVDLFAVTGEKACADAARRGADWIITNMQNPDGSLRAGYDANQGVFFDGQVDEWWQGRHAGHGKVALGLLKLAGAVGDDRYREAAEKLLDWTLTLCRGDGSLHTYYSTRSRRFSNDRSIGPLAFCVQGLLGVHDLQGEKRYLRAASAFGRWAIERAQADGGGVWGWVYADGSHSELIETPATAQLVSIWCDLFTRTGDREFLLAATRGADFLLGMQDPGPQTRTRGGFPYFLNTKTGLKSDEMTAWTTLFAADALGRLADLFEGQLGPAVKP